MVDHKLHLVLDQPAAYRVSLLLPRLIVAYPVALVSVPRSPTSAPTDSSSRPCHNCSCKRSYNRLRSSLCFLCGRVALAALATSLHTWGQ